MGSIKSELPETSDKLFIEESDTKKGAWISNPTNKFFLYSEGYREAGNKLYDYCIENPFFSNTLIYPIIYNYRQFLELRLKELIIMGNQYIDTDDDFPDEHSLTKLWNIYRNKLLPNIDNTIEKDTLDNVENLINEFNTVDPKSMSFRYPVTKGPKREKSIKMPTIDIENFKKSLNKLMYFFDWQWDMISHYKDLKQEMLSEWYGEYQN